MEFMAQIGYFGDPNPWGCCLYGLLLMADNRLAGPQYEKTGKRRLRGPGMVQNKLRGRPSGRPLAF